MALCLGFFGFKLDWVSIDCGVFVRTSFKSCRLMTELFKTSECFKFKSSLFPFHAKTRSNTPWPTAGEFSVALHCVIVVCLVLSCLCLGYVFGASWLCTVCVVVVSWLCLSCVAAAS